MRIRRAGRGMECDPKGAEKGKEKREDRTTSMQSVEDHFKRPFTPYRHLIPNPSIFPPLPGSSCPSCRISCPTPAPLCSMVRPQHCCSKHVHAGFDDLLKCISAITAWQEMKGHFGAKTGYNGRRRGGVRGETRDGRQNIGCDSRSIGVGS